MAQTIKQVMTADPVTIEGTSSVEQAAQLMKSKDIGDVIVVNRNNKLIGILTDRDIVVRCAAGGADLKATKVDEIATKDVKSVGPDTPIGQAVELMRSQAVRRLPVVEEGKLVGVVSLGDLAVESNPDSALAGISAAAPDHSVAASSPNGRRGGELGKALPAVAFGATVAFAMSKVRGRSRRKTVAIAAKKLRRAGKKLYRAGDEVGADAARRAAQYVQQASKDIRKKGASLAGEGSGRLEEKVSGMKRRKIERGAQVKLEEASRKADKKLVLAKRKLEDARAG